MKAKIIILLFLAISSTLNAQNFEPAQQPVNYCGNPNYSLRSGLHYIPKITVQTFNPPHIP